MIKLYDTGAYLLNGTELVPDTSDARAVLESKLGGQAPSKEEAARKYHCLWNSGRSQYIRQYGQAAD